MNTAAVLDTVRQLGEEHEPLVVEGADGVTVVRCLRCGHAVVPTA